MVYVVVWCWWGVLERGCWRGDVWMFGQTGILNMKIGLLNIRGDFWGAFSASKKLLNVTDYSFKVQTQREGCGGGTPLRT